MGLFLSSADGVFIFRILYSARKVVYKGKCHDRRRRRGKIGGFQTQNTKPYFNCLL